MMANMSEEAKGVAKKPGKQNQKDLIISIEHIVTSDADMRLSHAIDILLKAAEKNTIAEEEKLPRYSPREEGLTGSKPNKAVKGQQDV